MGSDYWRCKGCGAVLSTKDIEKHGSFCWECRNE